MKCDEVVLEKFKELINQSLKELVLSEDVYGSTKTISMKFGKSLSLRIEGKEIRIEFFSEKDNMAIDMELEIPYMDEVVIN